MFHTRSSTNLRTNKNNSTIFGTNSALYELRTDLQQSTEFSEKLLIRLFSKATIKNHLLNKFTISTFPAQ